MLEPIDNPNRSFIVDPPRPVRFFMSRYASRIANTENIAAQREKFEKARAANDEPHKVLYFHQLDDPYSHLAAQVLKRFVERYDIEFEAHLISQTGGMDQPEGEKLRVWARKDAGLVAPHYGLNFPQDAGLVPPSDLVERAASLLATKSPVDFSDAIEHVSSALWTGDGQALQGESVGLAEAEAVVRAGSDLIQSMNHYSGAMFHYGGEFYWGVDRLFHLEQRLMDLGVRRDDNKDFLVPRPSTDLRKVDASALTLHFYPSLNSPYTAIIYDKTIDMAKACGIKLEHKPVLPMIMRGVAASQSKGRYIFFDTKREADWFGVPFGPLIPPIGEPTRRAYSLLPWARAQGKDTALLSSLLSHAFAKATPLHTDKGMAIAVEQAGLDWPAALKVIGDPAWMKEIEENQEEMVDGMGLWGVPSYRLVGPAGEEDLCVWGQDRLWLVAAEINRRAKT